MLKEKFYTSATVYVILITLHFCIFLFFRNKKIKLNKKELAHDFFWISLVEPQQILINFFILGWFGEKFKFSQIYYNIADHGYAYLVATSIALFFIMEFCFYWTHRVTHRMKSIDFYINNIHHRSTMVTPLTGNSSSTLFLILNKLPQAIFVFFIPTHPIAFFFPGTLRLAQIFISHWGFDLSEKNRKRLAPIIRHVYIYDDHKWHHIYQNTNFGGFLKCWDRIFKTASPHNIN